MEDLEPRTIAVDDLFEESWRIRVNYDYLEITITLRAQRLEKLAQFILATQGGNNQGEHCGRPALGHD
jgi:hypothetical protein